MSNIFLSSSPGWFCLGLPGAFVSNSGAPLAASQFVIGVMGVFLHVLPVGYDIVFSQVCVFI